MNDEIIYMLKSNSSVNINEDYIFISLEEDEVMVVM